MADASTTGSSFLDNVLNTGLSAAAAAVAPKTAAKPTTAVAPAAAPSWQKWFFIGISAIALIGFLAILVGVGRRK